MTRVAAIDCGTNSTRLLVADVDAQGNMYDLVRDMKITRLGQGVDQTGVLAPDALERTFSAASDYKQVIDDLGATRLRIVATSATRDAGNRSEFVEGMKARLGASPEVISGEEEAALSFTGAVSSLGDGSADADAPYLVVDIGGGSTEFVRGAATVEAAISTNMGSVRVTERFGPEPWADQKIAAASTWIDEWLDQADQQVDFSKVRTLVGVAGTVTSIASYALGCTEYDPTVTHGAELTETQWQDALDYMIRTPVAKKAELGIMPPGRADVIGGGALIWRRVLDRVRRRAASMRVIVSEHDILDGIAMALAG